MRVEAVTDFTSLWRILLISDVRNVRMLLGNNRVARGLGLMVTANG